MLHHIWVDLGSISHVYCSCNIHCCCTFFPGSHPMWQYDIDPWSVAGTASCDSCNSLPAWRPSTGRNIWVILRHLLLMSHSHKQSAPTSLIISYFEKESFYFCVVFLSVFLDFLFFFLFSLSLWQQVWHRASRWLSCEHCLSGSPYSTSVTMGLWRRSNMLPFWYKFTQNQHYFSLLVGNSSPVLSYVKEVLH